MRDIFGRIGTLLAALHPRTVANERICTTNMS
jgi:hypothetical protein